jgi:hypothetical protein
VAAAAAEAEEVGLVLVEAEEVERVVGRASWIQWLNSLGKLWGFQPAGKSKFMSYGGWRLQKLQQSARNKFI